MSRGGIDSVIALLGILVFLVIAGLGYAVGETGFVTDCFVFIFFILFFYFAYDTFNLSTPVYTFFILSLIPHTLGIYGFYFQSPFSLQWDHITHFVSLMAVSLIFFRMLEGQMDKKLFSSKTFLMLFVILSASVGIGTFIENAEFIGFLKNGFGGGGLAFGAGDALPGQVVTSIEEIEAFGGGWFNTMYDLIWNFIGAFVGILFMTVRRYWWNEDG